MNGEHGGVRSFEWLLKMIGMRVRAKLPHHNYGFENVKALSRIRSRLVQAQETLSGC